MPSRPRTHRPGPGGMRTHAKPEPLRGTRQQRGYDADWERLRAWRLHESPLCVDCETEGFFVAATEVDHIVPFASIDDPRRLDPDNTQSLCKPHHSAKTAREDGGFGRWRRKPMARFVVCGPPGAGKSTFVQSGRKPGDLVWDYDVVLSALTGLPLHARAPDMVGVMLAALGGLLTGCQREPPDRDVWIIISDPIKAAAAARVIGAVVITIEATQQQCLERLQRAGRLDERAERAVLAAFHGTARGPEG